MTTCGIKEGAKNSTVLLSDVDYQHLFSRFNILLFFMSNVNAKEGTTVRSALGASLIALLLSITLHNMSP